MKGPLKIYTDGACKGNPGPGGWGVFIVDTNLKEYELSGYEQYTTNNQMEMLGAIKALEAVSNPESIELFTDSMYLKNGITTWIQQWVKNGWQTANKKPVKNQDLWMQLHDFTTAHDITWKWIKGHAGHFGNERADALARNAILKLLL